MPTFGGGGLKCTICDKTSYPAETIMFEKKPYHADCFRCTECNKKMDNAGLAQEYEDKIYCKNCFSKNNFAQQQKKSTWTKKEGGSGNTIASKFGGGGNPCHVCTKTVYAGEALSFEKMIFHPDCFKCTEEDCGKKIANGSNAAKWEQEDGTVVVKCKKCFAEKGYNRRQKASGASSSTKSNSLASKFGGGGNPCHICTKTVYAGEALSFEKMIFHPECFKCSEEDCGKKIANGSGAAKWEQEDGTVVVKCKKCFAEKGYNRRQKASGASSSTKSNALASRFGGGGNPCQICTKSVYAGEAISFEKMIFHPDCFKCSEEDCGKKIANGSGAAKWEQEDGTVVVKCRKCFVEKGYVKKQAASAGSGSTKTNSLASKFGGGGTKCVICAKTVYPAETIQYEKLAYHEDCFKCKKCDKKVNTNTANYHKEHGLFCNKCWQEEGLHRADKV